MRSNLQKCYFSHFLNVLAGTECLDFSGKVGSFLTVLWLFMSKEFACLPLSFINMTRRIMCSPNWRREATSVSGLLPPIVD